MQGGAVDNPLKAEDDLRAPTDELLPGADDCRLPPMSDSPERMIHSRQRMSHSRQRMTRSPVNPGF